jgi:hypothetical protein
MAPCAGTCTGSGTAAPPNKLEFVCIADRSEHEAALAEKEGQATAEWSAGRAVLAQKLQMQGREEVAVAGVVARA